MKEYNIHYYGQLDSLDSCYAYERKEIDGDDVYIQSSTRFGGVTPNLQIDSPTLFLHKEDAYYYFVIEHFSIQTDIDGKLTINEDDLKDIVEKAKKTVIR